MAYNLIMMNAHPCSVCQKRDAHFLCFCSEARLCETCIATHILQNPLIQHRTTAIQASDLLPTLNKPSNSLASARELVQKEVLRLETFQAEVLAKFQGLRTHYVSEVDRTIAGISLEIDTQIARLRKELTMFEGQSTEISLSEQTSSLLRRVAAGADALLTLSLEFNQVDIEAALRKSCVYTVDYVQGSAPSSHLYKFFGGSGVAGLFDAATEEFEQHSVAVKFAHNACWCTTPSGEILVTGGSLTGRSRNNVFAYNHSSGSVNELAPMLIARRSHASICYGDYCYVFGGVLDEDRISLCESLNLNKGMWSGLQHQMKERRAHHGVCQYADQLIICGGGETSSCEVFSPATGEFRLLVLPDMGLTEAASVLPVGSSLLIFHGNFSGHVSRLDPQSGAGTEIKELCYGNSWSNCAPLLVNDTIYLLRSDSIFKYNSTTGESTYVIRLAKTAKRREYD